MNTYIIDVRDSCAVSYLIDENNSTIQIRSDAMNSDDILGKICTGRVMSVVPAIKAAFVEFEHGQNGYLPLDECTDLIYTHKGNSRSLAQGDELLVTVVRNAQGMKLPGLSGCIEIAGKYCVLRYDAKANGVSSKITDSARKAALKHLADHLTDMASADSIPAITDRTGCMHYPSLIFRTNAQDAEDEELINEVKIISAQFMKLWQKAQFHTCPALVSQPAPKWLTRLRDLPFCDTAKIVIEDESTYLTVMEYLKNELPQILPCLTRYADPLQGMRAHYSLDRRFIEATGKKVWLKSGAFLMIEHTEALTAIDVNTGKNTAIGRKKDKEEKVLKTNLEAAKEIARQMRLRNLSGIILIDFINMEQDTSKAAVLGELRNLLKNDPVPARVIDITKLGLVELTRKKIEPPLTLADGCNEYCR